MAGDHAVDPRQAVLRIGDADGRQRGFGFLADTQGTVVTAHEVVAGLDNVVLHTAGGQARVLGPEAIEPLPAQGLALLSTAALGGLPGRALPIAREAGGLLVAVPHHQDAMLQGGVLGRATAMYQDGDRFHLVPEALLLELAGPAVAGAPVLDAGTGAVLAVVAPGLRTRHTAAVPAAPLTGEPLTALLARNGAAVPAYGRALNLGGVLRLASVQLAAASAGPGRIADLAADRVDRSDGLTGEEPQHPVTVLLGAAGSGRTTELAALTVRRAGGPTALPTLWLRGADLDPADPSLAEAVGRALAGAARRLDVPAPGAEAVARLCTAAGRPLLVVLDEHEEARFELPEDWLTASREWLHRTGARLLTACRTDGSERLAVGARVHWLGPLPADAATRAARRHGLPDGWLGPAEAVRPTLLRLAGELHTLGLRGPAPGAAELYGAHLDLCCLRIARRLDAGLRRPGAHRRGAPPPAGEDPGQLRRLATAVAGRLHEAARAMLGHGDGGLTGAEFDRILPGVWGRAVLAEGLLVRAGEGYRLAHQELAEWLQGRHLDLDGALRLLLAEGPPAHGDGHGPEGSSAQRSGRVADGEGPGLGGLRSALPVDEATDPAAGQRPVVPRHRAGVVVEALRSVGVQRGAGALDVWLHRLRLALEAAEPGSEADWWAGRLLVAVVPGSPEPAVHRVLLELLAERAGEDGRFGPAFWAALPLEPVERLALLRRLLPADGPEHAHLTAVATLLTAEPATVVPVLCDWLADRPAVAEPVAELLHRYRGLALDELTEALVGTAHPRADRLLARLAAEEPSALCRAVDRWSHDPRPERHVAAAVHALRTAPHATGPGTLLLRHTAQTLLAREGEPELHGAALVLLVRDPGTRAEHLPAALAAHRAGDRFLTPQTLAPALAEHPDEVLAALRERLAAPGSAIADGLALLAGATDPSVARRGAQLAAGLLRDRPERAEQLAEYLDRLLARGHDARPLLSEVLTADPPVRRAFARVLAAREEPVRGRLLDTLLAVEHDPVVLTAVLERLAERCAEGGPEQVPERVRELLRRIAGGWPEADAVLVRCAGRLPGFARLLAEWPEDGPTPPEGPAVGRMRALVLTGRDPQYAAAEAERGGHHTAAVPVPDQRSPHGTL